MPFLLPLAWLGGGAVVSWASSFFGEQAALDDASKKWMYIGGAVLAVIAIILLIVWLK